MVCNLPMAMATTILANSVLYFLYKNWPRVAESTIGPLKRKRDKIYRRYEIEKDSKSHITGHVFGYPNASFASILNSWNGLVSFCNGQFFFLFPFDTIEN